MQERQAAPGAGERLSRLTLLCRHNPRVVASLSRRLLRDERLREEEAQAVAVFAVAVENVGEAEARALTAFPGWQAVPLAEGRLLLRGSETELRQAVGRLAEAGGQRLAAIAAAALDAVSAYGTHAFTLRLPRGPWPLGPKTGIMGIINVTPDSFSDGGKFYAHDAAVAHGLELARQGADLLDVGGESTRPGAAAVPDAEQIRRVVPVIEALAAQVDVPISIDTASAVVAEKALDAGAQVVNDVTALGGDARLAGLVAERGVPVILMHMRGTPRTMQDAPVYDHLMADICGFLRQRVAAAVKAGVAEEQILIDPGIGFGKTVAHNLEICRRLAEFRSLGRPLVLGASRKSFIGKVLDVPAEQRLLGSVATVVLGAAAGAALLRVHDVAETVAVVAMADAIAGRG